MTDAPLIPPKMLGLPRDHVGRPIPWFVHWEDGRHDFRVADAAKIPLAVQGQRCWVCGSRLGRHLAFLIGPMCTVNRITSEPPAHRECAVYSAQACPFLSRPAMRRRETGLDESRTAPGVMVLRNPGAVAVWMTSRYHPFRAERGADGVLFQIGEADEVLWYAEGRPATRAEVEASIESGLPALREAADVDGPGAHDMLDRMLRAARRHLPPAEVSP